MFLRIDRLQIELPMPKEQDPNAAAAVQALLGGRFGEMSTLMNYMYQSFNFRGKKALKPYYDLIANIATEELGHIELVAATINSLLARNPGKDLEEGVDPVSAPLGFAKDVRNAAHFIAGGANSLVMGAMGEHWHGEEKKGYMPEMFAPEDLEAMERVKKALDPKGLANRGKVLPEVAGAHA